jgi:hypothetical protein
MRLYSWLKKKGGTSSGVDASHRKLRDLALPHGKWVSAESLEPDYSGEEAIWIETPGLMRLRFPALRSEVKEVKDLTLAIASPLLESDAQITFLVDGLDRLIKAERFREFAEQDLRALRGTKITAIVVAPLLLLYDKNRFLQDYFDLVKHLPAGASGPRDTAFLRHILKRRGALDLMNVSELNSIVKYSGGGDPRSTDTSRFRGLICLSRGPKSNRACPRALRRSTTRQAISYRTRQHTQEAITAAHG